MDRLTAPIHEISAPAELRADDTAYGEIQRALRGLRYGTIQLTIHDGRVVEIQKTERIRPVSCCKIE